MARRTLGTRQKLVFRLPPEKPRNPLVVAALRKRGGAHRKAPGALRAAGRRALKKLLAGE